MEEILNRTSLILGRDPPVNGQLGKGGSLSSEPFCFQFMLVFNELSYLLKLALNLRSYFQRVWPARSFQDANEGARGIFSSEEGLHRCMFLLRKKKKILNVTVCSRSAENELRKSSSDWVESIMSSRAPGKHFHGNVADRGKILAEHGAGARAASRQRLAGQQKS